MSCQLGWSAEEERWEVPAEDWNLSFQNVIFELADGVCFVLSLQGEEGAVEEDETW